MKKFIILILLCLLASPAISGTTIIKKKSGGGSTITHVGNWEQETSGTSISITVSGIQANDFIILYVINDAQAGPGITWPSGFTERTTAFMTYDSGRAAVATKLAAGGETSFAMSSGDGAFIAGCTVFRGVNTTTPLDVASGSNVTAGEASPFDGTAAITPATNNNMLVAIAGWDVNGDYNAISASFSGGGLTWSTPFGVDQAPGYLHIGSSYATQATAGAITVTATGTYSGAGGSVGLMLLSLRPQ